MSCSPPPAKSTGFVSVAVSAGAPRQLGLRSRPRARGSSRPSATTRSEATTVCPPPSAASAIRRPCGRRWERSAHGDVDDLLRRGDELDPRAEARGLDRREVAGERARVRAGRAGARLGGAAGEQHDRRPRLDRRRRGARELAPVAEVLAGRRRSAASARAPANDSTSSAAWTSAWFPSETKREKPSPNSAADHPDLEREVAALRDEPDRAGLELLRAELELGARVVDAEAVRARRGRRRRRARARRSPARAPPLRRPSRRARR